MDLYIVPYRVCFVLLTQPNLTQLSKPQAEKNNNNDSLSPSFELTGLNIREYLQDVIGVVEIKL